MDPDPLYFTKLVQSLKKRGFTKEAHSLEEFLAVEPEKNELITVCPICGNEPEPECVLCDGSGEIVSIAPDDMEDQRVKEELNLK